ncbi:hypothetical protein [Kitasatospora sp. NPDC001175]|uniref:hypothetical protein n=1 Tax=Kitasatospora sp. NPDC001175 TaxID=3157103 RepID=UPI003D01128A
MHTAKFLAAPLALGLALTATTVSVAATASAAAHPSHARFARAVMLTNADDGRTVTVARNDVIKVRLTHLRDQGQTWVWSAPKAGDPKVLRPHDAGTSPNGDASAGFQAISRGTSGITAFRHCVPDPGHVCPRVVIPWRVTLTVK